MNSKELYVQIRGSEEWILMASDDADAELRCQVARMREHGFKVVTDELGNKRVINPITKECEVVYKLA